MGERCHGVTPPGNERSAIAHDMRQLSGFAPRARAAGLLACDDRDEGERIIITEPPPCTVALTPAATGPAAPVYPTAPAVEVTRIPHPRRRGRRTWWGRLRWVARDVGELLGELLGVGDGGDGQQ